MKKPAAAIKIGMIVRRLEGTLGNDLANDMCDRKVGL
jgi:hypothetical protein